MKPARLWLNRVGGAVLFLLLGSVVVLAGFRLFGADMHPDTAAIAHAGGRIGGEVYTNSVAAFDRAYARGFRIIEVEIERTADAALVCGHDWERYEGEAPTLEALLTDRAKLAYPPCTLDELFAWFAAHPDARLVSDAKVDPVAINLRLHQALGTQLVAQAYSVTDVAALVDAGVEHVILTLYRVGDITAKAREITALQASGRRVVALTMPALDALAALGLWAKYTLDVPVYAHTVNACWLGGILYGLGVDALYTDDLAPEECAGRALGA